MLPRGPPAPLRPRRPLPNVAHHDRPVEIPIGRKVADGFVQPRFAALPARITWSHSRGLTRAGGRRNLLFVDFCKSTPCFANY